MPTPGGPQGSIAWVVDAGAAIEMLQAHLEMGLVGMRASALPQDECRLWAFRADKGQVGIDTLDNAG